MKIPVYSPTIRRKEMDAVLTCMVSEKIGPGEMNTRLVQLIRETMSVDGAMAVRSPALALFYALKALALEPESAVMISALAPKWHYQALVHFGYKPIVLDVDQDSALVTAQAVEEAMKSGGRVLLLHEPLGLIPNMAAFVALNVPIIEDISQSFGASFSEQKAGLFGVFSILGLEAHDALTSGGGAVLLAPTRREGIVLRKMAESASSVDLLPDINSALGFVQIKEWGKNNETRVELKELFLKSFLRSSHHKILVAPEGVEPSISFFPVVLSSGAKEVKQYGNKKEVEIIFAFEDSVLALLSEEETASYINAKSLFLRCVLFPIYPRLGKANATKIIKVLATLP